jgi:hypothetical protein
MRRKQESLAMIGISILGILIFSPVLLGQASPGAEKAAVALNDWSHHHIIFSRPATVEQAKRVEHDPRYWQQIARQSPTQSPGGEIDSVLPKQADFSANAKADGENSISRDWSQDLGTGGSVGAANYPAKYSLQTTTANCSGTTQPDFVVYSTGLYGVAGRADIVAFDNLYSGCTGTVPTVYWAYNNGYTINTSPVLSRDGSQVAFVGTVGGVGSLILVKWSASTTDSITHPTTLPRTALSAYPSCTAPCMTTIELRALGGVPDADTASSVFYDYSHDTMYVGDDSGWLHKMTPVFNGVPTDIRTGGWPVQVNPGSPTALGSPVHDFGSGNIFVADTGGFLYRVDSSTAAVTVSGQLDFSAAEGGAGIVQGPVVDSTAGLVFVFASSDGSGGCIGLTDCAAVYQLSASFITGDTGSESIVGASTISGSAPNPLYIGAFDSAYENSVNATGNLYVCGNTGGPPILYQVPIVAGVMNGLGTAGPVLSTSTTPCSPVTDVANPNVAGGTEWIFASPENGGAASTCAAGGCVFNFKDTPWKPLTAYTVGQEILDTHFQLQVVSIAGTSGAAAPGWSTIIGHSTTDGTVHWLSQGPQSAFTLSGWVPSHAYALHAKILDGNNNVQFVTTAGTSGGTMPVFSSTAGAITSDGATLKWTNLGALGTASLAAAGGTSGIIIDNTVGSGTLAGASQVYFSTLSDQACSNGTGGCAVQASQSALQ